MKKKPQVIDFFCGAGGFSEGFRQQGFDVVMGIDNWAPAIDTHNLNHNLKDKTRDVLDFRSSIEEIDKLPNTEVIVGSPPCVLFSLSNKGGKSDKKIGIKLIESFLRVIAVKKHQPSSRLAAWFMENVPNSKNYIRPTYTFKQLNLEKWAKSHNINPDKIALNASVNGHVLNTAEFGTSQKRARFVCGEIASTGRFPELNVFLKKEYQSIASIRGKMPPPNAIKSKKIYIDPNYPSLKFKVDQITDHFYDSGIYESQWRRAKIAKLNHPFMGKMSFPEDESRPSRTIMATRSMTTRESLIYKSEYNRRGDGEYRLPTIREIATLMGFPYTYQFSGFENTKWRQIGNAVCPAMSSALAKSVRLSMGLHTIPDSKIAFTFPKDQSEKIKNLNTFSKKSFNDPPRRKPNARFRRHPFKEGNLTVALTNYHPLKPSSGDKLNWYSSVYYGTGRGFTVEILEPGMYKQLQSMILEHNNTLGKRFIDEFNDSFRHTFLNLKQMQNAYENPQQFDSSLNPDILIDKIAEFISSHGVDFSERICSREPIAGRSALPIRQLYAMYAINKLISSQ